MARGGAQYAGQRTRGGNPPPQVAARVEQAVEREVQPKLPSSALRKHRAQVIDPTKIVVIDGANVGMKAGITHNSTKGLKNCLEYFKELGYEKIVAFVPQFLMDERRAKQGSRVFDNMQMCKQLQVDCAEGRPGIASVPSYVALTQPA